MGKPNLRAEETSILRHIQRKLDTQRKRQGKNKWTVNQMKADHRRAHERELRKAKEMSEL